MSKKRSQTPTTTILTKTNNNVTKEKFYGNTKPLSNNISNQNNKNIQNHQNNEIIQHNLNKNYENKQNNETKQDRDDNLHVLIRVRPPLSREIPKDLPFRSIVLTNNSFNNCSLVEYLGSSNSEKERQKEWLESSTMFQIHRFSFDYVFDMDVTQIEVFNKTAKPAVSSILEGYNSTVFAYGQTGTGKTFTMEGFTYDSNDELRGIIPRCVEQIFEYIESFSQSDTKFMVRASYLQIYNESVSDLLKTERVNLQIREDKKKGVHVEVSKN